MTPRMFLRANPTSFCELPNSTEEHVCTLGQPGSYVHRKNTAWDGGEIKRAGKQSGGQLSDMRYSQLAGYPSGEEIEACAPLDISHLWCERRAYATAHEIGPL